MEVIRIQTLDWRVKNEKYVETDEDGKVKTYEINTVIQLYGRTENKENKNELGKSVYVELTGFESSFYVTYFRGVENLIEHIAKRLDYNKWNRLSIDTNIIRKEFYGFTGDEDRRFVKVSCRDYNYLMKISKILMGDKVEKRIYREVEPEDEEKEKDQKMNVLDFKEAKKVEKKVEKKKEIIEQSFKLSDLIKNTPNIKSLVSKEVMEDDYVNMNIKLNKKLTGKEEIIVYESNKDPIIQYIHDRGIKTCGWVEIREPSKLNKDMDEYCEVCYTASADDLVPVTDPEYDILIQPFKLCAYDIECISCDDMFPNPDRESDEIVSISATFSRINEGCYSKYVIISKECPDIENAHVIRCKNEAGVILAFVKVIQKEDPDFTTTWHGFGFDDIYIYKRAVMLDIIDKVQLSRVHIYNNNGNMSTKFITKKISSAAFGDCISRYFDMEGRICFDLEQYVKRNDKLPSYKLDYVASYYFREQIKNIKNDKEKDECEIEFIGKSKAFFKGQYTILQRNDGVTDYEIENNRKFKIIDIIDDTKIRINGTIDEEEFSKTGKKFCCNVKDDVKPKQIFEKYRSGTPEDLKDLSLYNIQDCELCNNISNKLNVMINNIGMANVCYVPLSWIFHRGQSPKVFSLVSRRCKEQEYLIKTMRHKTEEEDDDDKVTFQGACVIEPTPGIKPLIFCLDYAALYPRTINCFNISHETYVTDLSMMEKYKDKYTFQKITYKPLDKRMSKLLKKGGDKSTSNKLDEYVDEEYDTGDKECWFAKSKDPTKVGLICSVLVDILKKRASVRKQQKAYKHTEFMWSVLEGLQLAYKVTSNSIYGQLGCEGVGPIAWMDLAACTTAGGRMMLQTARNFAENIYPKVIEYALEDKDKFRKYMNSLLKGKLREKDTPIILADNRLTTDIEERKKFYREVYDKCQMMKNYNYEFKVAYGDTDSIFVAPNLRRKTDNKLVYGLELRKVSIDLGELGSLIVGKLLPPPEDLEYEKILTPFVIITKKRYVGNLYENDPMKFYQKNMGIVLKRRDNAQIVKYVVGGVVYRLLNIENQEEGQEEALRFVEKSLKDMIDGKFKINMFVITKTLKEHYKNEQQIAHAVLAKRIAIRDPGNAPAPNDRIAYVYKVCKDNVRLQGDRIEEVDYFLKHKLQLDYTYYIEHQIKEPCQQFLDLFNPRRSKDIFDWAIKYAKAKAVGKHIMTITDFV